MADELLLFGDFQEEAIQRLVRNVRVQIHSFSPQEGFVLSRINSQWDVKSIMKISPMKELDVLMIFHRLIKDGVIRWKKKKV